MHILYLIESLVPAGAERSLAALAPNYVERGMRLDVGYLLDRPGLQADLEMAGATIHSLAGPGGRPGWAWRARKLIAALRPDLVHTTLFEADIAGRIGAWAARVPVVSSLVNVAYGPEQLTDVRLLPWKVRAAQALDVVTARAVVRFHAVTELVAEAMARRLRIPRDRIDVIPRGRDPGLLGRRTSKRRALARKALGLSEDPLILAIARHERQKGLDVLLQALPLVLRERPESKLAVAGRDGLASPELRAATTRLGLGDSVRFLGSRDDVPELLCAADAFVFPSRWEGLPGAVLEAMALEAPIVSTDLPPIREAAPDPVCAWLVPPDRPDALAAAILAVLSDPTEAAERARRARSRFLERFTIERVADQMVSFYERALSRPS
jgi:glycosyltransferase involved in cell wall biosynthesis